MLRNVNRNDGTFCKRCSGLSEYVDHYGGSKGSRWEF